jgi:hypothetical protein
MAKKTMEELRASWGNTNQTDKSEFVNNYYNFWDMKTGESAVVRFLPDLSDENPRGFLVEKIIHKLTINGEEKKVPCLKPFGEECPICKLSQSYYKSEGKGSVNGKKYYITRSYVAQALVIEDPLPPNKDTGETNVGKVRFIALGFQLHNIIKEAFADQTEDALKEIPYDFHGGYDFIIKKSLSGDGHAAYTVGTKFKNSQRSLTEDELAVVGDNMVELSTLLPKNPGLEKVQAMLTAELNGEQYNEKHSGDTEEFTAKVVEAVAMADVPSVKVDPTIKAAKVVETASSDVDDMLAEIRLRRKAGTSATASSV